MRLLSPVGLAWLLLALPILALYLLRLKRQPVIVASVLLWSQAASNQQANLPFQRLRRHLLLLLQLLALALATLALARPAVRVAAFGGQHIVIVVDTSASMAAVEPGGRRFDQALAVARRTIDAMEPGDQAMLVTAADRTSIVQPLTSDRAALQRALDRLSPTDGGSRLADAVALAATATQHRNRATVLILSDGALPADGPVEVDLSRATMVGVGQPVWNAAITALASRRSLTDSRGSVEVLLTIAATGPVGPARDVEFELRLDDRLFDLRSVRLAPGEEFSHILEHLPGDRGLLEVRLNHPDALAADNLAFLSLGSAQRREIWLLGAYDRFLDTSLSLDSTWRLVKSNPSQLAAVAAAGDLPAGAVVVANGVDLLATVPAPALYFRAGGPDAPGRLGGEVESPALLDWRRDHPVTGTVPFEGVAIAAASELVPEPWATTLMSCEAGPLILAGERSGRRQLQLGFDPRDSDLPLRPAYPILISHALHWLAGSSPAGGTQAVRAGQPVTIGFSLKPGEEALVRRPDGQTARLTAGRGPLVYAETDLVGRYQVESGNQASSFAVSLLSAAESDLTPRQSLTFGQREVGGPNEASWRHRELWRPVALLLLLLLSVEWWWYHRRG